MKNMFLGDAQNYEVNCPQALPMDWGLSRALSQGELVHAIVRPHPLKNPHGSGHRPRLMTWPASASIPSMIH